MSRVARAAWLSLLVLCLPATAFGDVVYLRPDALSMPDTLFRALRTAGADMSGYLPPGADEEDMQLAIRGRVWEVRKDPSTGEITIMFQPCKTEGGPGGVPRITWLGGELAPGISASFEIKISDIKRLHHEMDDIQDLRWMLSNRDELLYRWWLSNPGANRTTEIRLDPERNPIIIGGEPFNSFFRAGGGIPGQTFDGFPSPIPSPVTFGGKEYELQEGWLCEWLKFYRANNRVRTAAERNQAVQEQMRRARRLRRPPQRFLPELLETDISVAVSSLLRAAAMDRRYAATNMFGFGASTDPVDGRSRPLFAEWCKRVVKMLCDLVIEPDRAAQELGHRAREAVIGALEGAAIGRSDPYDVGRPAVAAASAPSRPVTPHMAKAERKLALRAMLRDARKVGLIDKKVADARTLISQAKTLARAILADEPDDPMTTMIRRELAELETELGSVTPAPAPAPGGTSVRVAGILADFPVDPTEIAMIALEVISESSTWQIPQYDSVALWTTPPSGARANQVRPGRRLSRAVLELARDGRAGQPRTNDGPRSGDHTVSIEVNGVNREITSLEHAVRETLKHLLTPRENAAEEPNAAAFRRHVTELLVDSITDEAARTAEDGDPDTWVVDRGMREIATDALSESGYADPGAMEAIIDELFVMAQIDTNDPSMIRSTLRRQIQRDAVATLAHLASLNDGTRERDATRRQRKKGIARLVHNRVSEMAASSERGFSSEREARFFRTLKNMMDQPLPPRPLEGHATAFFEAYSRHLGDLTTESNVAREDIRKAERMVRDAMNRATSRR